jgi:hypothetical protein
MIFFEFVMFADTWHFGYQLVKGFHVQSAPSHSFIVFLANSRENAGRFCLERDFALLAGF